MNAEMIEGEDVPKVGDVLVVVGASEGGLGLRIKLRKVKETYVMDEIINRLDEIERSVKQEQNKYSKKIHEKEIELEKIRDEWSFMSSADACVQGIRKLLKTNTSDEED